MWSVVAVGLLASSTACVGATGVHTIAGPRHTSKPVVEARTVTRVTAPLIPQCVGSLTTELEAGQLLMVLVADPSQAGDLAAVGAVGGYALTGDQQGDVRAAIASVGARSHLPLLVSGDEEGGTVQRLRTVLGLLPSAAKLVSQGSAAAAGAKFADYAQKMASLGFNMNLGPSLDVGAGSALGTRSFGNTVDTVSSYGNQVIAGVRRGGLIPVAKHWPGIGGGTVDPHVGESQLASIQQLRQRDEVPFDRAIAAGVPALMVSHATIPGLTGVIPASLSHEAITDELRGREHFDGVVVTDSLGMGAVSATGLNDASAAVRAIEAGADIALISDPKFVAAAHRGIVNAVNSGQLTKAQLDRSVARVLVLKGITGGCPV